MRFVETIRLTRRKLPHWEVEQGRYFVTVRCADSLPVEAVLRLRELHKHLSAVTAHSPQFAGLQRQLFRSMEKYLDAGYGSCPLREPPAARIVMEELESLLDWQVSVPHFSIMPNHCHALLEPKDAAAHSLSDIMKRLKGRTAKRIRRTIDSVGPFWQSEWFDRWVRDEAERDRMIAYIQNNPVKAGLAPTWQQHPWTK